METKILMNTLKSYEPSSSIDNLTYTQSSLPENYDSRDMWKIPGTNDNALTIIPLDQAGCGSCWAFAAADMFTNRMCIQLVKSGVKRSVLYQVIDSWTGETGLTRDSVDVAANTSTKDLYQIREKVQFSPYYIAMNSQYIDKDLGIGCYGNILSNALRLITSRGCVTTRVFGLREWLCSEGGVDKKNRMCKVSGLDRSPIYLYRADSYVFIDQHKDFTSLRKYGIADMEAFIMREIQERGPICVGIDVYSNFFEFYKKNPRSIYTLNTRSKDYTGYHAMTIYGWGVDQETGIKYWILKNSWGPDWADKGYCRIQRGVNLAGVEDQIGFVNISDSNTIPYQTITVHQKSSNTRILILLAIILVLIILLFSRD